MLDEECNVPKGSDLTYVTKMHGAFKDNKFYSEPPTGKKKIGKDLGPELTKLQFVVVHYAEPVQYTASEWLDKTYPRPRPTMGRAARTFRPSG